MIKTTAVVLFAAASTLGAHASSWESARPEHVRMQDAAPARHVTRHRHFTRHVTRRHVRYINTSSKVSVDKSEYVSLKNSVKEMRRELNEVREKMGATASTVQTLTGSLASYAPMPLPDIRRKFLTHDEPVGPTTASLPIYTPEPLPPEVPVPSDTSRLAIGSGRGVHSELLDVLHEASRFLPGGYTARIEAGKQQRRRGGYHPRGLAADVRIFDASGKPLGWYQDPKTFRTYEEFAQHAKIAQMRLYPSASFVWGGYFKNSGPFSYGFADLMHMQWGGPMGGGSWQAGATGVNRKWLEANGGESVGLSNVSSPEVASLKRRHREASAARRR